MIWGEGELEEIQDLQSENAFCFLLNPVIFLE